VDVEARQINVVEQLGMELDRVARAHKNHDLFGGILFEERKKQQKTAVRRAHNVALL
jgi:hypothetical protein